MSPLVRTLVTFALLVHGFGMLGGAVWLALPKGEHRGFGDSWLFVRLGRAGQAIAALVLWGVSGVAFVAAGIGFWTSAPWFGTSVLIGASMTLVSIALWAGAIPVGAYLGGAFSLVMLIAVLLGVL